MCCDFEMLWDSFLQKRHEESSAKSKFDLATSSSWAVARNRSWDSQSGKLAGRVPLDFYRGVSSTGFATLMLKTHCFVSDSTCEVVKFVKGQRGLRIFNIFSSTFRALRIISQLQQSRWCNTSAWAFGSSGRGTFDNSGCGSWYFV